MSSKVTDHRSQQKTDSESMQGAFESARCGTPGARDSLMHHYMQELRQRANRRLKTAHCASVEPDDIVQGTLLSVLRHIEEFRPRDYRGFEHYLYKTLNNKIRDELRHMDRMRDAPSRLDSLPFAGVDPYQDLAARELWETYRGLVEHLPERTRLAVILRIERRLPYAKVAEAVGCSHANAARMLVSRAMRRIAAMLNEWLIAGGGDCGSPGKVR